MGKKELPIPELPGQVFEPRQVGLEDIPVIAFEIYSGADEYVTMLERRRQRVSATAPVLIHGIPVTTLIPNPDTMQNHHIVRLTDKLEPRASVDLLFRDKNLYMIAFRRTLDENVGNWYRFDNEQVPTFIHAEEIGIDSRHEAEEKTTIGGSDSFHDMFMTTAYFQDGPVPLPLWFAEQMKRAKQRAIVGFGEAMRFQCVREEVRGRIEHQAKASHLPGFMWCRMKSWGVFSCLLINVWRSSILPEGHPNRQKYESTPDIYASAYGIQNMAELQGDILIILSSDGCMIKPKKLERMKQRPQAAFLVDPGLD